MEIGASTAAGKKARDGSEGMEKDRISLIDRNWD